MKIKDNSRLGITFIELVVVVFVIAILAGIALPVFSNVSVRSADTKALSNAKQIGLACKLFASDHSGHYPSNLLDAEGEVTTTPPSSSNETLGQLLPDYIPEERIFWLALDKAYCNTTPPDNKSPWLGAGENHWGYVINLTEKSDSRFPLIADGAVSGATNYTTNEEKAGGTWKGLKAIVICVDGSGFIQKLNKKGLVVPGPDSDQVTNLLQAGQKNWLGANNLFLNPIPRDKK